MGQLTPTRWVNSNPIDQPLLSNIYLHYALNLWFEKVFTKTLQGRGYLVRYADDFVAWFETREDAKCFVENLKERLAKFNLEVEPSKTRTLEFGKRRRRGGATSVPRAKVARSFSFLGFTAYMGKSRNGYWIFKLKTESKRMRKKLGEVKTKLKRLMLLGHKAMVQFVKQHLQGHIHYFGVSHNMRALSRYCDLVQRMLLKWMNRCSQSRSIDFATLAKILVRERVPKPRIIHKLY